MDLTNADADAFLTALFGRRGVTFTWTGATVTLSPAAGSPATSRDR